MRTVASFRQQAAACRALARQMDLREQRDRLLEMAEEWEALAAEREAALQAGTEPRAGEAATDQDAKNPACRVTRGVSVGHEPRTHYDP
jgi:hypothetical protein